MPFSTAGPSVRPAAKSASSAQAAWLGRDSPGPGRSPSSHAPGVSPRPAAPGAGPPAVLPGAALADGAQPAQHGPRAVDVIDAPAAVPGPRLVLGLPDEGERPLGPGG